MKKFLKIPERNDPSDPKINPAEKILHLSRYEFAVSVISKFFQVKKMIILDAACGKGYGSYILQNIVHANVIGVDLDTTLVANLTKVNKNKKIKFISSDIKTLPLPENSIDCIVCFETIEHLNKIDGIKTIKEFRRVLKKNGIIIISSPNIEITRLIKKNFPKFHNPFHLHEYQPEELKKLLEKNNLEIIKSRGQYLFFPVPYIFPRLLPFFKFMFKPSIFFPSCLSRYFITIAKKIR